MHMQQSQQAKVPFSLVEIVMVRLLQLHATTTQDGTNWMTCNQLDVTIVQSSTAIKFMSLEAMEHSEFEQF